MFRKFLEVLLGERNTVDVSAWNEQGRAVARFNSEEIGAFHEGRKDAPNLKEDSRTPEMAEAVLSEVIALNAQGRGSEARALFDPAHAPFIGQMEKSDRGLLFCAILGPDEFLVRQGAYYQDNTTWHIRGGEISKVAPLAAFAWSRNRQHFLAVMPDGQVTLGSGYSNLPQPPVATVTRATFVPLDLPEEFQDAFETPGDRLALTHVAVSDDGKRILLCDAERGVVLLYHNGRDWAEQLIFPSVLLGLVEDMRDTLQEDEEYRSQQDMLHAALSPDGKFIAVGHQFDGHYLIDIEDPSAPKEHATLGYLSEYPHDACFSSDSRHVAFNSCHFYNGITFCSEINRVKGLQTPAWERHSSQVILNSYLRVYASGFLPESLAPSATGGAFLLAGSGFTNCVAADGQVQWELDQGSSAGGLDVCPQTGRILLASYSGFLHLLDPSRQQDPPLSSGYKTPMELRRWIFWDQLKHPISW